MKKKIFYLTLLLIISSIPILADYVNILGWTNWSRIDSHTIIIYRFSNALCIIKVNLAFIYFNSTISIPDTYIHEGSDIIIDGKKYQMSLVKKL